MVAVLSAGFEEPCSYFRQSQSSRAAAEEGEVEEEDEEAKPPWDNLPPELLVKIFSYLDDFTKENVEATCCRWQDACHTSCLWRYQHFFFNGDNSIQVVHQGCRTIERKGSYLRHVTVEIGCPRLPQAWLVSQCVQQLLDFISRHPSAQHISTFKMKLNFFTQWRFFTVSKRNILVALNNFLTCQRRLQEVDFTSCRLCADDGMRILRALHMSFYRHSLRRLELHEFFQRKYTATSGRRFTYLITSSSFSSLQELGVDAKHIDNTFLLTLTQRSPAKSSLRRLKIYYEMFKCPKICVTEKCWDAVRRACPDLNAAFIFSGWLAFPAVKRVLTPSVPLTECTILWPRVYRQHIDRFKDLAETISRVTQLYSNILERFCLRSDIRPYHDLELALVRSATQCRHLKEFKVTLHMTLATANTIRQRLAQRSPPVDFRLTQRKYGGISSRLRSRNKEVSPASNTTQ